MRIKVTFYGILKQDAGTKSAELQLAQPDATLRSVVNEVRTRFNIAPERLQTVAYVLNDELVDLDQPLADGDEIGLLPPVSGG